jgi:hypothetical protein
LKERGLNLNSVKLTYSVQNGVVLLKKKEKKERTRRRVVWSLFIVFLVLPERNSVGAYFAGAFNA